MEPGSDPIGLPAVPPPPPFYGDPSAMKLTRGHSCVLCQQRKVRCDKQKPCASCVKAGAECKVVPPQPPRRRRKKPHERDLISQLKKYESLLAQNGIKFDPVADDLRPGDSAQDVHDLGQDLSGLKTSPESATAGDYMNDGIEEDGGKFKKYMPYFKEYRQMDVADSSDEDYEGATIHHAFDTMFDNNDGFPFVIGGGPASVTNSHPSAIQILQLWQVYISNVNPLLKISHIPTLQGQIIGAGANLARISKPLEALMFGIYFIAVTSMREDEVQSMFGEDKSILVSRYQTATVQALVNAGFMRSTEIMVLQALFLYLLSVRQYTDPRSLFCLIGIAVRIATRLGLHRDGAQFGLSPFDTELRRRLWWQIGMLDKRIAEMTGSSITALSSSGGDCRLPLNLNDTDLNIHAKDAPQPYSGSTEMVFALCRIELNVAGGGRGPGGIRAAPTPQGGPGSSGGKNKARVNYSPSPSSPDVVTQVANLHLPADLEGFCTYMETSYLKHCDPKIPLHYFTLTMTRQALCRLRIVDFMYRGIPTSSLEQAERDALFAEAIRVVEYDNVMLTNDALGGFMWYMQMHFPFPAYIFIISELLPRGTGDLCDRAWDVMIENHERRGMMHSLKTPVHIAFGNMFVKAWDAREAKELQLGRRLETPKLITMLRQRIGRVGPGKRAAPAAGPASSPPPMPGPNGVPQAGYQYHQQQHQQQQQQGPSSDASASPSVGVGSVGSGMSAYTPEAAPGSLNMDSNMMYGGFDGNNSQMFGADMGDSGFGNSVDWNVLMQYSGFHGFGGPMGGPMYGAGPGGSSSHGMGG